MEGDGLIGRIDMKAQRDEGCLQVRAFWPEKGIRTGKGRVSKLEAELQRIARFSGCSEVGFDKDWLRKTSP